VTEYLRQLHRQLGRFSLLWDRLQAHRARRTRAYLQHTPDIRTTFFPPYAPELNPMEYGWNWLKRNPLANVACFDLDSLASSTRRHCRSLQLQEILLRSFIHHSPHDLDRT
jgi:transposase